MYLHVGFESFNMDVGYGFMLVFLLSCGLGLEDGHVPTFWPLLDKD